MNRQVSVYRDLVSGINECLSNADGRQRNLSMFALGGRGFLGLTNVASAALTAASPAANAVWIQGSNATNAAYNGLATEMDTQRLSGIAVRESMQLTANNLIEALEKLKFEEIYEDLLRRNYSEFDSGLATNREALRELEIALVLKPFTHVVTVKAVGTETTETVER